MKCANCGNELASGELFCKKCDVNTDEADLSQEKPETDIRRDKLCAFAAWLFLLSGLCLIVKVIKDWYDSGIKIQDTSFAISVCFTAVMAFACRNIYHPVKLKRILKIVGIVLAAELLWQLYSIIVLAVKTASKSGAGVSVTATAVVLPVVIYSALLLVFITGLGNVKSVLKFFLILMLLFWSITTIISFLGAAYIPDFKMNYFDTLSNFAYSVTGTVAMLIFIKVLPYTKSRFKRTQDAVV